jgi:hypothetical protein
MANRFTKKKLDAFYAAIGRFVVTWAEVELYLDLLALKMRRPTEDVSHQLQAKINFVREAFQVENSPFANEALKLIAEIEGLANTRHDYVHGARIGHSFKRSALSVKLGRLLQPRSKPRKKPVRVTTAEIEVNTDQLYFIGGKLLDLLENLATPPQAK